MKLRRGLILAAIHLAVTASLFVRQEEAYWEDIPTVQVESGPINSKRAVPLEDVSGPVNPCVDADLSDRAWSPPERIVALENLPIALITGWHVPCTEPSRLDDVMQKKYGRTRQAETPTAELLCGLAVVQWFLVGSFPLFWRRGNEQWWWDPGAFITVCTVVSALLLLISWALSLLRLDPLVTVCDLINQFAQVPMLLAAGAWVWWLILLLATPFRPRRRRSA